MTLKLNGTTSGSVSIDAPATGSNISFTLPGSVGSSGQLLSTNGSGVLSFVNGGKILQVVRATDTTNRTTTSTTFVDVTGMSITITPTAATSVIYVICTFQIVVSSGTNDQTQLTDSSNVALSGAERGDFSPPDAMGTHIGYSSPSSTSAQTYKLRFRSPDGNTCSIRNDLQTGQLIALEIGA